ncbi:MAG: hypothetical protein HQK49_08045 [Oligoflexia bacterium]|nr:hypothetical protein [Oligoflexia bacterium]
MKKEKLKTLLNAVELIKRLSISIIFSTTLLLTSLAFINISAVKNSEGGEGGGGGGMVSNGLEWSMKNPFFLGDEAVYYCIQSSTDVSRPYNDIKNEIMNAFETWKDTLDQIAPQNIQGQNIARNFVFLENCNSNVDLVFYIGIVTPEIKTILATKDYTIAFTTRTSYDKQKNRAKGYIWIAPDNGPYKYNYPGSTKNFWSDTVMNAGTGNTTLKNYSFSNIVTHEIGHVFGFNLDLFSAHATQYSCGFPVMQPCYYNDNNSRLIYQNIWHDKNDLRCYADPFSFQNDLKIWKLLFGNDYRTVDSPKIICLNFNLNINKNAQDYYSNDTNTNDSSLEWKFYKNYSETSSEIIANQSTIKFKINERSMLPRDFTVSGYYPQYSESDHIFLYTRRIDVDATWTIFDKQNGTTKIFPMHIFSDGQKVTISVFIDGKYEYIRTYMPAVDFSKKLNVK